MLNIKQKKRIIHLGNIFNWSKAEIRTINSSVINLPTEEMCSPNVPGVTLIPEMKTRHYMSDLCKKMGGNLFERKTFQEHQNVKIQYDENEVCKANIHIWTVYNDLLIEGSFVNEDNVAINSSHFDVGEPNGDEFENCVALRNENGKFIDIGCEEYLCGACFLHDLPKLRLRGYLPSKFNVDKTYYWTRYLSQNKFIFEGTKSNQIMSNSTNTWFLIDISTKKRLLYLERESYPFGRKKWVDPVENRTFTLSFDNCKDDEFNCANGMCISMTKRCNQKDNDCPDNSDEENCSLLSLPPDYNKNVPARGAYGSLNIFITNFTFQVDDIIDAEKIMLVQFGIWSVWRDSRVIFTDIEGEMNKEEFLDERDKQKLWTPRYTMWQAAETGLQEDYSFNTLSVIPLQKYKLSGTIVAEFKISITYS